MNIEAINHCLNAMDRIAGEALHAAYGKQTAGEMCGAFNAYLQRVLVELDLAHPQGPPPRDNPSN